MATTSSSNFTSLYGANASPIVPALPYGNANVVSLLAVSTDGSNTIGNISATGNIAGTYFLGNGSQLTGIGSSYTDANVATFLAAFGSNTIVTTGNITGGYIFGNGSQLTGLPATYGNANVAANLAAFGSNPILTTGNITGGNLFGNGAGITGITVAAGTQIINGTSNVSVALNGNSTVGVAGTTVGTFGPGQFSVNGNVRTSGFISATGDVYGELGSFGNVNSGGYVSAVGDVTTGSNISATGTISAAGIISAAGNITAGSGSFFLGNGSQLTGVTATVGPIISVTGNITGGNILTGGVVSAAGNVTGNYFIGNGSALTGITATAANSATFLTSSSNADAFVSVDSANTQVRLPGTGRIGYGGDGVDPNTFGSVDVIPAQANLAAAYSALTFVNLANFLANPINSIGVSNIGGQMLYDLVGGFGGTKTLNISAAGVQTNTTVSAAGNITAPYFVGNGSTLTNLTGGNVVGAVANATFATSAGTATSATSATTAGTVTNPTQANITSVGTLTSLTSSGNIVGGNINTAGIVSAVGNVVGSFFIGNGSALTGIASSYGNANVAANLAAFANNPISTTGNITAGNLITSGAVGNIIGANYVTANYFVGDGSLLTSLPGGTAITNGNSTIAIGVSGGGANVSIGGTSNVAVFATTGLTVTGIASVTGNVIGGNVIGPSGSVATGIVNYKDYVATITYAATITPNIALGSIQQVTLTGNVTMNAFGGTPQAGQSMVIKFIQDATGSRILTSTMKWAGGAKTLSTAANAVDIASVFYDGTTYWASLTLDYA